MHELSITKQLIQNILHECKINNIKKPKKIQIELGILTTYKKDPILFYYNQLKKEISLLNNSNLDVLKINGELFCNNCNNTSSIIEPFMIFCPICESLNIKITKGKEFNLKKIIGK
jgi:hydrogenase nickel incorporation protein HypA/HybF